MSDVKNNVGSGPPFLIFELQYHSLCHVVECHRKDVGDGPLQYPANPVVDIAIIGLVAQFEAYCKHQFAALISFDLELLSEFAQRRAQTTIPLDVAAMLLAGKTRDIGSAIAELYDFGSASIINGLFRDLVNVTPFSKDESARFDNILRERHLLVHHAGVYTLQWLKNGDVSAKEFGAGMIRDRLHISTDEYHERAAFLFEMAMKVARTSVRAVRERETNSARDDSPQTRLGHLLQGLYGSLD